MRNICRKRETRMEDAGLRRLMAAIALAEDEAALGMLTVTPALATAALRQGATRANAADNFLSANAHHLYAGDTALHVAAAAHRPAIVRALIELGADVAARNRRGATPLHYAADGDPDAARWNPAAQASAAWRPGWAWRASRISSGSRCCCTTRCWTSRPVRCGCSRLLAACSGCNG